MTRAWSPRGLRDGLPRRGIEHHVGVYARALELSTASGERAWSRWCVGRCVGDGPPWGLYARSPGAGRGMGGGGRTDVESLREGWVSLFSRAPANLGRGSFEGRVRTESEEGRRVGVLFGRL